MARRRAGTSAKRTATNLHFAARPARRFPRRAAAALLLLVVAFVAVVCVLAAIEAPPAIRVTTVLPATVRMPGSKPALAWPAQGEAAVEVEGYGSLGASGPPQPVPIASVAKVMTAYVILHDHPVPAGQPGFTVTITAADVADYRARLAAAQSVVAVTAGEQLSEQQLLSGLIVASGNNLAAVLAEHDAGSQQAFVSRMNAEAAQLGMTHTTYTDPSGLAATTISTAADQLKLAEAAMALPAFAAVAAMTSVTLPGAGTIPNFDRLVGTNGYIGIKTGSDSTAGGCLMFADRVAVAGHTVTVLGVVLGQDTGQVHTATLISAAATAGSNLVASVTAGLGVRNLLPAGTEVAVATDAQGHRVRVVTGSALSAFGFAGSSVPAAVTVGSPGRRLRQGQTVGEVVIGGQKTAAQAGATMPAVSFMWRVRHVL